MMLVYRCMAEVTGLVSVMGKLVVVLYEEGQLNS